MPVENFLGGFGVKCGVNETGQGLPSTIYVPDGLIRKSRKKGMAACSGMGGRNIARIINHNIQVTIILKYT
ncbi:MAG: hypothetical protein IPG39_13280 [Bacteroidetes bacterium]|nr:hypothetical protein [Bacteroidota bacterium]